MTETQPRSRSSSVISDVTSLSSLSGKFALGSKPSLVTRIARTGLGTRLIETRIMSPAKLSTPPKLLFSLKTSERHNLVEFIVTKIFPFTQFV